MEDFSLDRSCDKCGGATVSIQFIDQANVGLRTTRIIPEHLEATCSRCGYTWKTKVLIPEATED